VGKPFNGFDDETIFKLFGAEAAEDEIPERLKSYFFRNKSYNNIRGDLPLRILVGHKGIGKSALLKMSYLEDIAEGVLALWLQPNELLNVAGKSEEFIQRIEQWKNNISRMILERTLESMGTSPDASIIKQYTWTSGRVMAQLIDILSGQKYVENVKQVFQKKAKYFLTVPKIRVYIDDLDRGWEASKEDIKNISALINALRDLCNEDRRIQFRIGLRTDAYFLVRTSDESTDRIESYIIPLSWTNHDILVVVATRISNFFEQSVDPVELARLPQPEVARLIHAIIDEKFSGSGHWDRAPIHTVLLSLTRKRPRDLIKLLSGAAREAYKNGHQKISSYDLESTFPTYSTERIQDLVNEFRSEMPNIERLLYNMKNTRREFEKGYRFFYSRDRLISKLRNIIQTQSLTFSNLRTVTPTSIAEFLYKIDFIIATGRKEDENKEWIYFDQNRMLVSQFVDFGYAWEVHPAYRWALQPDHRGKILETIG